MKHKTDNGQTERDRLEEQRARRVVISMVWHWLWPIAALVFAGIGVAWWAKSWSSVAVFWVTCVAVGVLVTAWQLRRSGGWKS